MAALSDYLENEILDHILGTGSYTMPTVYAALFTAAPSDAGGGTEATGGSYARTAISFDAAASANAANQLCTFPQATGAWGTITHFGLFDASTAGNLLVHGALDASKIISSGDLFSFQAGDLDITAA